MVFSGFIGILSFFALYYTISGTVRISLPYRSFTHIENNGHITLTCTASCLNSTCRYAWTSSDVTLSGTASTIALPTLRRKAGVYTITCTVTNVGYGTTGTCTRKVDILYPPDVTLEELDNELICTAKGNPSNYTYTRWKHTINDVFIRNLTGSERLIVPQDYQNRGKYECQVTNGISGVQTGSIEIKRNAKPILLTQPLIERNVSKGGSFRTLLEIYGYPESLETIIYKTDGSQSNPLPYFTKIETPIALFVQFYDTPVPVVCTSLELSIDEMKEDYFGEYDVLIRNTAGNNTAKIVLTPKGPPDAPNNFIVTEISHNYAVFRLTSGFHNGANQTVVIQYRRNINGSVWSIGSVEDIGNERNMTVVLRVEGLVPLTDYVFQAYCFNVFNKSRVVKITATTKEEPANLALVVGAIGGAIFVLLLIVVVVSVVVVLRRKRRKKKDVPRMLPKLSIPNILEYNRTNDYTPPPSNPSTATPDIYENTNAGAALFKSTDQELYENTHLNNGSNAEIERKESNYANAPLFVGASFKSNKGENGNPGPAIYSNTEGMVGIKVAQAAAASSQYITATADGPGYNQYTEDSTGDLDDDYLDMEVCTLSPTEKERKPPERTYSNREAINRQFISKKQPTKIVQDEFSESSEVYMDMDEERRDSVPDYQAPLPPPPQAHSEPTGDGYVNMRKKGKRPF